MRGGHRDGGEVRQRGEGLQRGVVRGLREVHAPHVPRHGRAQRAADPDLKALAVSISTCVLNVMH